MKYLGVDFGLKRVGLAASDGLLASPLKVLTGKNVEDLTGKVKQALEKENVDMVVVGLPEGKMATMVKKFARALKNFGVKVILSDETLSTQTAIKLMIEMGVPKRKRAINDSMAAALILQNYLDNLKS